MHNVEQVGARPIARKSSLHPDMGLFRVAMGCYGLLPSDFEWWLHAHAQDH